MVILNIGLFSEILKINLIQKDQIIFLNVGQGDSILLTSERAIGLIDLGPGNVVVERLNQYVPKSTTNIEFVILTHFDKDHIEGFLRLSKLYFIKNLFISYSKKENSLISEIKNTILEKNIKTYYIDSINDFKFGNFNINILWPLNLNSVKNYDSNDYSIATEIYLDKCNLYSAGDLSSSFETLSLENSTDKDYEVLKLGHHGSNTSTDKDLIKNVSTDVAIISSGENNKYGHPHIEVLNILKSNNISTFETKNGDIKLSFNERNKIIFEQDNKLSRLNCF